MRSLPLKAWCLALFGFFALAEATAAEPRREVDLSGPGWSLWLDQGAAWKNDPLFFPVENLARLPVNAPTGGWAALGSVASTPVSVPGTVEEYLQQAPGPAGDLTGVSWWWRTVAIPPAASPRRLLLRFESARQRSEVYVNGRLVGYDLVGNTPFEVDISPAAKPGETIQLAVRITDPGGNFDWRDTAVMRWGAYSLPMSHGFGGITGRVRLVVCDPVHVDDLYLQNTPAITTANALVTVRNATDAAARRDLDVTVFRRGDPAQVVFRTTLAAVALPPGDTVVPVALAAPSALAWDLDHPNLYVCAVTLRDGPAEADSDRRTFGFRWFAPEDIGGDAVFRLNGKRIVLRTAISWGFWPENGIFPTDELAERQVRVAKSLGLNMLNFHRAIGNPIVLEQADELGLLYFEEPGGYRSADRDPFGRQLSREKLLRMVRRDRSHPSLVIYNLINEWDSRNPDPDPAEIARHREDLRAAHAIDPSRVIVHTSAWARAPGIADPAKLHFRPFDDTPYLSGWYDYHHAGGPAVWTQDLYRDPENYYNRTENKKEIVYWGEEGAISTPPRLALIKAELEKSPHLGWDGGQYLASYREFDDFLTRKHLRGSFPTVDALTTALGEISYQHQGRKIELLRLDNTADGYAINGWESEIIENHSGIVDCFRNPKADPAILAYYNQPLYVAVMVRDQIVAAPGSVVADFYAINEKDLRGPFSLRVTALDPAGRQVFERRIPVTVAGGEVYGQLLARDVRIPLADGEGSFRIQARLEDASGAARATGRDEVLAVDWKRAKFSGRGAVWGGGGQVQRFLQDDKGIAVPTYADALGKLDWVVVDRSPATEQPVVVPAGAFRDSSGQNPGLATTFLDDQAAGRPLSHRTDPSVDFSVPDGAAPDPAVPILAYYGVRWEGTIVPPVTGTYLFATQANGNGAQLTIDGRVIPPHGGTIALVAGQPAALKVEFHQRRGAAQCRLLWAPPDLHPPDPAGLLARVRDEGTTLLILGHADAWMDLIAKSTSVKYSGSFVVGGTWVGGQHFVRAHPLFKDLPVDCGMDWPYQALVHNGNDRSGLLLDGEELVVGAWHSRQETTPERLGTAVGIIPCGRGRIIVSTLDLCDNLNAPAAPAEVARKVFCNFLEYASPAGGAH